MLKTISQIYRDYKIMPSLQLHMYRVTGVAQLICENFHLKVDSNHIISACLLHDMGNILKFNLDIFPEFLQPEGYDYWKNVQEEYRSKYGSDEHISTLKIAQELNVSDRTYELLNAIGFSKAKENYESEDFGKKICAYSDMRVQPYGVTSLDSRLEDGKKRFNIRNPENSTANFFDERSAYLEKIEAQIFAHSRISAADITEERVLKNIKELEKLPII